MKTTYRIAIAELRSLFCSPVAWLILVIFAVQVGVAFGNAFDRQVQGQALGYTLWDVTASIFTGWMGIFPGFLRNLYLYIPLLTMGLMSREYSSGSIKLLFSSPVTDSQIIFVGVDLQFSIDSSLISCWGILWHHYYECRFRLTLYRNIGYILADLCLRGYRFVYVQYYFLSSSSRYGNFGCIGCIELCW